MVQVGQDGFRADGNGKVFGGTFAAVGAYRYHGVYYVHIGPGGIGPGIVGDLIGRQTGTRGG